MKTILPTKFKLASELELKKFTGKNGWFVPTAKQLGLEQHEFDSMSREEIDSFISAYNSWMTRFIAERREKSRIKRAEKNRDHWFFKFSEEKKKELICATLELKTQILVKRITSSNISESTKYIYLSAEKAEAINYQSKDMDMANVNRYLPHYSEEHDCLYGSDNRFIYCWLKFFPTNTRKRKLQNLAK